MNTDFFVVGDIEEKHNLFKDAINCIIKARALKIPVIFLGDILDRNNLKRSVKNISKILSLYGVPITNYLSSSSTIDDVRRCFEIIYSSKLISAYKTKNKLFKKSDDSHFLSSFLEREGYDLSSQKKPMYLFIFGNKEIDFIKDMASLKMGLINNDTFSSSFTYSFQSSLNSSINFSSSKISLKLSDLNTLIAYFNLSRSFVLAGDFLLTHIYHNALILRTLVFQIHRRKINNLICGHHRCFGQYFDPKFKSINRIFILDISSERDDIQLKNFIKVSSNGDVNFFTDNPLIKKIVNTPMNARSTFLDFSILFNLGYGLPTDQMFLREIRKSRISSINILPPDNLLIKNYSDE